MPSPRPQSRPSGGTKRAMNRLNALGRHKVGRSHPNGSGITMALEQAGGRPLDGGQAGQTRSLSGRGDGKEAAATTTPKRMGMNGTQWSNGEEVQRRYPRSEMTSVISQVNPVGPQSRLGARNPLNVAMRQMISDQSSGGGGIGRQQPIVRWHHRREMTQARLISSRMMAVRQPNQTARVGRQCRAERLTMM